MAENENTVGGLRAVEQYYRVIREIASGLPVFLQSQTRLNTPSLGTLMPENFRKVTEMTRQCIDLFMLEFAQAARVLQKFEERELRFNWISLYMPIRFLLDGSPDRTLMECCSKYEISADRLCFALPDTLLNEDNESVAVQIQNLRNRGFHFMLTDFGEQGCPVMKLADYPIDYVMLSTEVTQFFERGERAQNAVRSIVGFIDDMGGTAISDGVSNSYQAESLYEAGCTYCAGALAGKYTAERYIRKKDS